MIYKFCAQTNPGLNRENNEDSVKFDESIGLGVLADGMGGYNAGEVASGMATEFINSEMARWLAEAGQQAGPRDIHRALEICVDNANLAIFNAAKANAQYAGMGTTLVLGVFHGETVLVGHIGDSRCYRLRQGAFEQITKDHSLLQEQIDAGLLTLEQAATSLNKNLVTRALGVDDSVMLEIHEHLVEPGDLYLMCSDGLSDMVKDAEIGKILEMPSSLEKRAQCLIDAANANGGRDNITVLLVKVEADPEKRGLISRLLGK
jgi:PPM family protein phosphatase